MGAPLSDQQRQAINSQGGTPLEVTDSQSQQVFYLISAEQYQKWHRTTEGGEEIDPSLYEFEDLNLANPE